jgi:oligopeptide transport system substrate-binding protein
MRRNTAVIGLLIVAAGVATAMLRGCGEHAPSPPPPLIVSIGINEPQSLLPPNTIQSYGQQVLHALFTPLVEFDSQTRAVELAAAAITSRDNQTWTIRLREGWSFHNGEPVTADSYIDAWNAGAWGPNKYFGNSFFDKIDGYEALNPRAAGQAPAATRLRGLVRIDALTFEVRLKAPYANFKSMLGHNVFLPMPRAAFSDVARNAVDPAYAEAPIGQGPFRMQGRWQHDQAIRTTRFAGYAGARLPQVDGVEFRIYQNLTTQYQDLLAGQLDVVPLLPMERIAQAQAELGARFRSSRAPRITLLVMPSFEPRLRKVEIRRALSMALDRAQIARVLYADTQQPLQSMVPPLPGWRAGACGPSCEFRPDEARALFNAAGGASVMKQIEISYGADSGQKDVITAVCNQWRATLGVACVENPLSKFSYLVEKARNREPLGLYRLGMSPDYPAFESFLEPLFASSGAYNLSGYGNPQVDRWIAAGHRAATPAAALQLYQQAEDQVLQDLPAIPLLYTFQRFAHSARIAKVEVDVLGRVDLQGLTAAAK